VKIRTYLKTLFIGSLEDDGTFRHDWINHFMENMVSSVFENGPLCLFFANIFITIPIAFTVGVSIWAGTNLSERWGKRPKPLAETGEISNGA
jgi:hypothetical protein